MPPFDEPRFFRLVSLVEEEPHAPEPTPVLINGPQITNILQPRLLVQPEDIGKLVIARAFLMDDSKFEWEWFYRYHFLTPVHEGAEWWANGADVSSLEGCMKLFSSEEGVRNALVGPGFHAVQVCQTVLQDELTVCLAPVLTIRHDSSIQGYREYKPNEQRAILN